MDIPSLLVASALNSIAAAIIMLVVFKTRRTYAGFGWWTAGLVCLALGASLFVPENLHTINLILVVRNGLLMTGLVFIMRGLVLFRGERLSQKVDLSIIGSFLLLYAYYSFAPDSLDERIILYSVYAALVTGAIAWITIRNRPNYFGSADVLLATCMGLFALLSAWRAVAQIIGDPTTGLFVEQKGLQSVYVLVQIVVTQLFVLTLVSMNSQRIEFEYTAARQEISGYIASLEKGMKATLDVVNNMMKLRDPYTAGHEQRVSALAREIALEMGWTRDHAEMLAMVGTIHDVGKIGVPAEILSRPGKLNNIEYNLVKTHAQLGFEITKDIQFPIPVAEIILTHHERLDGSGYPRGLKGDAILPEARILMVADALESMTSHRPYRGAMSIEDAKKDLLSKRGTEYDAAVVDATLNMIEKYDNQLPA